MMDNVERSGGSLLNFWENHAFDVENQITRHKNVKKRVLKSSCRGRLVELISDQIQFSSFNRLTDLNLHPKD